MWVPVLAVGLAIVSSIAVGQYLLARRSNRRLRAIRAEHAVLQGEVRQGAPEIGKGESESAIPAVTEARLRESERRYHAIMEHAPDEIILKDADGRYVEASRSWWELFGLSNEEVAGKTIAGKGKGIQERLVRILRRQLLLVVQLVFGIHWQR